MNFTAYRKKWLPVIVHALVWLLLFSLPYLLRPTFNNNEHHEPINNNYNYHYIINCLSWIVLFYVNAYVLVPRFIYKKKYRAYITIIICIIAVLLLINWLSFKLLLPGLTFRFSGFAMFYVFPCLFFLATGTALKMLQDRVAAENEAKEKENENLKTELSFLRSQVSPHFMFNVLNNMVALARKKSDILEPSLIKLSSLLRYMLYETDEEKVPLIKEIDYLQSFIDLQQQRFGKNVVVETDMQDIDGNYFIEPMLLIPFVENAFKHGTGLISDAFISTKLQAKNGILQFTVTNKFNCGAQEIKDKTSGIGLANVTRRLNLLYGKNHTFLITKNDNRYTISLQLNLH